MWFWPLGQQRLLYAGVAAGGEGAAVFIEHAAAGLELPGFKLRRVAAVRADREQVVKLHAAAVALVAAVVIADTINDPIGNIHIQSDPGKIVFRFPVPTRLAYMKLFVQYRLRLMFTTQTKGFRALTAAGQELLTSLLFVIRFRAALFP